MIASKLRIARQMLDTGTSTITEIAATIGVGRATVYRHLEPIQLQARGCTMSGVDKLIEVDGVRLALRGSGSGMPPVVCLSCAGGATTSGTGSLPG